LLFTITNLNYRLVDGGKYFEYRMMLRTRQPDNIRHLSEVLINIPTVLEFGISPTGD
jgi:putative Mg2+ transporter-C (MgtC) family protein